MCIQSLSFIHSFARLLRDIAIICISRLSLGPLSVRAYINPLLLICLSPVLACIWSWRDMGLINCLLSCNWTGDGFLDCQLKSFGSAERFFPSVCDVLGGALLFRLLSLCSVAGATFLMKADGKNRIDWFNSECWKFYFRCLHSVKVAVWETLRRTLWGCKSCGHTRDLLTAHREGKLSCFAEFGFFDTYFEA